ncbi:MAG: pyridoxal-phosphate dependent enzyme [Polyangiaceae bacterium]
MIGRYPTPVQPLTSLSTGRTELWVKRDDRTSNLYGGNKVRKLEHIFERARARSARRLVTFGAAGSHHVLATTMHGKRAGFDVTALLTPQHRTAHAVGNLRIGVHLGLDAVAVSNMALVPVVLATVLREGDFIVGPGGSTLDGTFGYIDAARELADQIDEGLLPAPDAIVVALGSAGTVAGLLAGIASAEPAASPLQSLPEARIVGVRVVDPLLMGRRRALLLAFRAARAKKLDVTWDDLSARLIVEPNFLGEGYGKVTDAGARATEIAAREGLALDSTYTAKTFAAALDLVEKGRFERVLYWHTLSSAPLDSMLAEAPPLPAELDRLFTD